MSVLIVEAGVGVRQGLKKTFSQQGRGFVMGEAKTSDEATVRLARQPWDLVILDIAIPARMASTFFRRSVAVIHPPAYSC